MRLKKYNTAPATWLKYKKSYSLLPILLLLFINKEVSPNYIS